MNALGEVPLPENLSTGLAALEYLPDVQQQGAPSRKGDVWWIPIEVNHETGTQEVPASTPWMLVVSHRYPQGTLKFCPMVQGGITDTFPHQQANDLQLKKPFRAGAPCLTYQQVSLKKFGKEREPSDAYHRLHWNASRLSEWVHHARSGTLLQCGEPFEHPDAREILNFQLGYLETPEDLPFWTAQAGQHGVVHFKRHPGRFATYYPTDHRLTDAVIKEHSWGTLVQGSHESKPGIWLMLHHIPLIGTWGFPRTWGELRQVLREQHLDLDLILRQNVESWRDGHSHVLMLGYPIPETMGQDGTRVHWQGVLVPPVTRSEYLPGFRMTPEGRWRHDRSHVFADHKVLEVMKSSNHHQQELGSRGLIAPDLRSLKVVVVGAGALGATIAEHLARIGMEQLTVMDVDLLHHGNLVRHPLTLKEVGESKALALVRKLNQVGPHVKAVGINGTFPPRNPTMLKHVLEADVLLDTTGSDRVIEQMGEFRFPRSTALISVSLGWKARSLYAHAERGTRLKVERFYDHISSEVDKDRSSDPEEAPREGIGCWHPVFPALHTDVQLLAAVAVKFILGFLSSPDQHRFHVYEQSEGPEGFTGVVRRTPCS